MNQNKFNRQINGIRGIFCVLIVLYHFFIRHSGIEVNVFVPNANILWGGFFVLSGFYLRFNDSKCYWLSKINKTYIPYLISILLIFLITGIFVEWIGLLDLVMNILCLPMISTFFNYVDGAHWYIVYLFYFYCVFYFISLISKLLKKNF